MIFTIFCPVLQYWGYFSWKFWPFQKHFHNFLIILLILQITLFLKVFFRFCGCGRFSFVWKCVGIFIYILIKLVVLYQRVMICWVFQKLNSFFKTSPVHSKNWQIFCILFHFLKIVQVGVASIRPQAAIPFVPEPLIPATCVYIWCCCCTKTLSGNRR